MNISEKIFNYSIELLDSHNPYYELKIKNYNYCIQNYEAGNSKLNYYPLRATIQTNETCNLKCIMCQIHGRKINRPLLTLSFENLQTIVHTLFPYLIEVHPTNIGEPLLYKYFDYLCDKLKEYGVLLDLTTNGMLLNESTIQKISPILKDIKISFDGYKKETFESIRIKSNYERIKSNIERLLKYKRENNHKFTITLQMTIFKTNYKELLNIIEYAHEIGLDRVKAYHVFSYFNTIDEISLINHLDEFEEIRVQAIKLAEKYQMKLEISEPNLKENNLNEKDFIEIKCPLLWAECWIDCDGRIYPCHSHTCIDFGTLEDHFLKGWNSPNYRILRDAQVLGIPTSICHNCGGNYLKKDENQNVPYDINNFLNTKQNEQKNNVKWSNRSKQFFISR